MEDTTFLQNFGDFLCAIFVRIFSIMPTTPSQYYLSSIAAQLGDNLPMIGAGLIYDIIRLLAELTTIAATIKIVKILPAKF